jgi:hypothetical protein
LWGWQSSDDATSPVTASGSLRARTRRSERLDQHQQGEQDDADQADRGDRHRPARHQQLLELAIVGRGRDLNASLRMHGLQTREIAALVSDVLAPWLERKVAVR